MLELITGTYELNDDDRHKSRYAAFSTLVSKIVSSGYAQGGCTDSQDDFKIRETAINAYKRLVEQLNVTNEDLTKLDCYKLNYRAFTKATTYGNLKMFLDYRDECSPSLDVSPFILFVEKDFEDCKRASKEWKCLEAERSWRCGEEVSTEKGQSKKCSAEFRCCSNVHYCGNSKAFCDCDTCQVDNDNVPLDDNWVQTYPYRIQDCL